MIRNTLILLMALFITACGGGGGDSTTTVPVPTQDATGVWEGTVTEVGVGTASVVGIVSGNQLRFISDSGVIYSGTINVTGNTFVATTTNILIGGTVFSTSNLSGTVASASTLSGTFTSSNASTGSFTLSYSQTTTRGSSLSTTDDNWTITSGGVTTTLSIDATGALTGSDTDGCVYNGALSIIDANINIYGLVITASSCGVFDGAYSGYAVTGDTTIANDTLIYVGSNANYIAVGALNRI